jgi:glutamate synthase (NADPH/NADH) small chain
MRTLPRLNRRIAGDPTPADGSISAGGKRVVVIGGGDTGSDCIGTCHRQGATEVFQFELLPQPPKDRAESTPWPPWPMKLRTSHAHEEGGHRDWSVSTIALEGDGRVQRLKAVRVELEQGANGPKFVEQPGSEVAIEVDLVLLAMGFTGVRQEGPLGDLGVEAQLHPFHLAHAPGVVAHAGDHTVQVIIACIDRPHDVVHRVHRRAGVLSDLVQQS